MKWSLNFRRYHIPYKINDKPPSNRYKSPPPIAVVTFLISVSALLPVSPNEWKPLFSFLSAILPPPVITSLMLTKNERCLVSTRSEFLLHSPRSRSEKSRERRDSFWKEDGMGSISKIALKQRSTPSEEERLTECISCVVRDWWITPVHFKAP